MIAETRIPEHLNTQRPAPELTPAAQRYASASVSRSTADAYRSDWNAWSTWCMAREIDPLPADETSVANYVSEMAQNGAKASTIKRRLAGIAAAHTKAGVAPSPTAAPIVREVLSGILRTHGVAKDVARPLSVAEVRAMADLLDTQRPSDIRDRALLLFAFHGALRRSEVVAVRVEHLTYHDGGILLLIPKSKTDAYGEGQTIPIPSAPTEEYCPVAALRRWLKLSGSPANGPVWLGVDWAPGRSQVVTSRPLTDRMVDLIVKRTAERAGLPLQNLSAHSLRAGHATAAAERGVAEHLIMQQTRHRSVKQLREYIRTCSLLRDNSASALYLEETNGQRD